jgi:hypothetical protein
LADLLRAGADQGLSFCDPADVYGSRPHGREALRTVRRGIGAAQGVAG